MFWGRSPRHKLLPTTDSRLASVIGEKLEQELERALSTQLETGLWRPTKYPYSSSSLGLVVGTRVGTHGDFALNSWHHGAGGIAVGAVLGLF